MVPRREVLQGCLPSGGVSMASEVGSRCFFMTDCQDKPKPMPPESTQVGCYQIGKASIQCCRSVAVEQWPEQQSHSHLSSGSCGFRFSGARGPSSGRGCWVLRFRRAAALESDPACRLGARASRAFGSAQCLRMPSPGWGDACLKSGQPLWSIDKEGCCVWMSVAWLQQLRSGIKGAPASARKMLRLWAVWLTMS